MKDILEFLKTEIEPKLHNKELYNSAARVLPSPIYIIPAQDFVHWKERWLNAEDCPVFVSQTPIEGYIKVENPAEVFNRIPSSRGYEGGFQHDWWSGGNLYHSILTYRETMELWDKNPDTEDALRLGSLLHDVGKVCAYTEEYNTIPDERYCHEIMSSEILKLITSDTRIINCGIGHAAYNYNKDRGQIEKTDFRVLAEDYDTTVLVSFADKIASGRSRVMHGRGLTIQKSLKSLEENCLLMYGRV